MPEHFRQYHLTQTLGKKYSHTTYLASPTDEPERQVVLIVFASSLFHLPRERENWLTYVHHIKQLQHPHLLPILDMGLEEEQPFLVREYLPNGSLRSRLKQIFPERLQLQEALTLVSEVGQALTYIHNHNVIHGNIKPENILFNAHGHAVLTDFTLVSRKDALIRDQTTEEYAFCYLAPEQFSGTCDARSDQYALGCLAYELIAGQVPFAAQSLVSMLEHHSHTRPVPLSERVTDLLPSLEAAVLKALMKDPTERFADCSLFLEILRSVLPPAPVFPLGGAPQSDKQSITARSAQAEQAKRHLSPSRQAAKRLARQTAQRMTSKHFEPAAVASEVEVEGERAEPETTLSVSHASSAESAGSVAACEDRASSFQLTSPLSGKTNHLDKRAHEEDAPDLAFPDPFLTEEEDTPSPIVTLDVEYKENDQTEEEMNPTLTSRNDIYAPHPKRPLHRRAILLQALLLSVTIALLAYAFWPLMMGNSGTSLNTTHKKGLPIPNTSATVISIPLIPAQITQASATNIPTAHPSVTNIPTAHPSVSVISTPTTIAIPSPTPTPIPQISYEAESSQNTFIGSAQILSCTDCSGGKRVAYLGKQLDGSNGALQFNNVNKSNVGSYTITMYYTEGDAGSKTGYISVNAGPAIAFTGVYTGSWETVKIVNMTISLSAGNNTIEFFNSQQGAPDIDRIIV